MVLFGPTEQVDLASDLLLQFEVGDGRAGEVKIFQARWMPMTLRK